MASEPTPQTITTRPSSGLARGLWEAPPAAFLLVGAALVVGFILLVLYRFGVLKGRSLK